MKEKLKTYALALVLFVWLSAQSLALAVEKIEPIYMVHIKGQDYPLVELLHEQRDSIPKINALRFRRGALYREYRIFDSNYPVRFYEQDWEQVRQQLKPQGEVPDHRTFAEKHPYAIPTFQVINGGLTVISYFI